MAHHPHPAENMVLIHVNPEISVCFNPLRRGKDRISDDRTLRASADDASPNNDHPRRAVPGGRLGEMLNREYATGIRPLSALRSCEGLPSPIVSCRIVER